MNNVTVTIWGRRFELEIKYDCYTGEEVLNIQREAVGAFVGKEQCVEDALDKVKMYCLENNRDDIGKDTIENIFKYVLPKYLYVPRDEKNRVIALMCNYKFDMENGIAIVFKNEMLQNIGKQDLIL